MFLWLYARSNRKKVDLTLKICIRNKISHPLFVVKKPKWVISLKDNEEKQNCSKAAVSEMKSQMKTPIETQDIGTMKAFGEGNKALEILPSWPRLLVNDIVASRLL